MICSRRLLARAMGGAAALLAAACGGGAEEESGGGAPAESAARVLPTTIMQSVAGDWRPDVERARDAALRPEDTAEAFGLDIAESVLELEPGAGYWTAIVAPVTARQGGRYVAAITAADAATQSSLLDALTERFADAELFGAIETVAFDAEEDPPAEPGSVAAAFSVDDVATWMAIGVAEDVFAQVFAALEPGGLFGVLQPRAPSAGPQDPGAGSGYVQEAYVIRLAEEAGFTLESASDLHANPADDASHPFGVWTLAPYRLTAPLGAPGDPAFDRSAYDAIGEPDRMTLLFRKPRLSAAEDSDEADEDEADETPE